jgi:hypothetical protein
VAWLYLLGKGGIMKWGVWFMILLAANFIVWSPYTGKIVQAETPQAPKKKTAEINPDNVIWDELPDKNQTKKLAETKVGDAISGDIFDAVADENPRFEIEILPDVPDEKLILVPSPPTEHSISRPRFQMVTNDKTGETFVLDRYDGAVWSSLPYARKFIQCPFVNALDNDKKTKEPNP